MEIFPARLGARERLVTYAVGYGVGVGVPLVLGVCFAIAFGKPWLLLFPLPFILAFGSAYLFRPTAFAVLRDGVAILRPVGPRRFPLRGLRQVVVPASTPEGSTIGLARVDGLHGRFGLYWNRNWGRFRVYITDPDKTIELRFEDIGRVIISPDDPGAFLRALHAAVEALAVDVTFDA